MTVEHAPTPVEGLEIDESDVPYAQAGRDELLARVYRPAERGDQPYPTLVHVHGGAWNINDRTASELANRSLAGAGIVVVSLDFRQGPDHKHPAANQDIAAGVRWAKLHAADYGGDPATVGIIGNSSGGHLAMLAAFRPHAEAFQGTSLIGESPPANLDATVRYVVACWPVSDPLFRYRYASKVGRENLVYSHLAYFEDEPTMKAASVPRILDDGEAQDVPPMLLVQPGEDQNVPMEMTQYLMRAYQRRQGRLLYAYYPGEPHAFTYEPSDATESCLALIADYILREGR